MSKEDYILSYWGGRTMHGFWTGHSPTRNKRWTQDSMRLTHLPARGFLGKLGAGPQGMGRLDYGCSGHGGCLDKASSTPAFTRRMHTDILFQGHHHSHNQRPSLLFLSKGVILQNSQPENHSAQDALISPLVAKAPERRSRSKGPEHLPEERTTELGGSFSRTLCP